MLPHTQPSYYSLSETRLFLVSFSFFVVILNLILFSVSVLAEENDKPSFYGQRAVTVDDPKSQQVTISFQRRAIAPQINKNNDEDSGSTLSTITAADDAYQEKNTQLMAANTGVNVELREYSIKATIPLSRNEKLLAQKASHYFNYNWRSEIGLIDSVQGYPHTTMWDIASGIGALLAMEGLHIISSETAHQKIEQTLTALRSLPLYDTRLPNREYRTTDGSPSGAFSQSPSQGNGWSALDIGRLLIWLEITARHKPEFRKDIEAIKANWQLDSAVHENTLYGELKTQAGTLFLQEGRLGYLQYAARGYQLTGLDVGKAFQREQIAIKDVDGFKLYIDQRNLPYATSDPYVLNAIELGRDQQWWDQLETLYALQETKSIQENRLWVFSEDAISKAPWFSYNNFYIYGKSWLSTAPGGTPIEDPQIFSNKVALGLSVLFPDHPFSHQLSQAVIKNSLTHRSVPTGIYMSGGFNAAYNINTNSLILTALWFKNRNYRPLIHP